MICDMELNERVYTSIANDLDIDSFSSGFMNDDLADFFQKYKRPRFDWLV